jgi:hypothetical protein
MDTDKILNKVKAKLDKKARDLEFITKDVKLNYFQSVLEEKFLEKLKEKWNLKSIDKSELDWDWKDIEMKWYVNLPRSSGVLNIQIIIPDQVITVKGGLTYTDENDKDHDFDFDEDFEVKDLKADYSDLKMHNTDIAPSEFDWSNKEVKF